MGLLDALGSIAVAGMDKIMESDEYKFRMALTDNGEQRSRDMVRFRNQIAAATRPKPPEPSGKDALIGVGILAAITIGAALLSNNDNKTASNGDNDRNKATT